MLLSCAVLEARFRTAPECRGFFTLSGRLGVVAGAIWILRPLFWATVPWAWALRFAGELEPTSRKDLILLLFPLTRQLDSFLQWAGWLAAAAAFGAAGAALRRWPSPWHRMGWAQLGPAVALLWALPFHFLGYMPQRFAAPGFPAAGAFFTEIVLWETLAAALFATGIAILYPGDPTAR
jgi:hypothetical protein